MPFDQFFMYINGQMAGLDPLIPISPKLKSKLRPILITLVAIFIIVEIVALSPSPLEQPRTPQPVSVDSLTPSSDGTLATGIPKGRVPDYTIERFEYVSTQAGQKQWKLVSDRAFLYNAEKIVHARTVTAYLFDSQGKITTVTGKEAKYFMNQRDLEIFGDVKTVFPDGFETRSEYMHYRPTIRKIEVPLQYRVHGNGQETKGQAIAFESDGMDYDMENGRVVLPRAVRFVLTKKQAEVTVPEQTIIDSDRCVIERTQQIAWFTMSPSRPLDTRFVKIRQPTMVARARQAQTHYGDYSQLLQYIVATEDVLIREIGKKTNLRYATGGRAEFNVKTDVVVLKEYPQVYQDNDTVTGDVILLHRDSDVIEVENSNAFSEGQGQP